MEKFRVPGKRLGRAPRKSDPRALMMAHYPAFTAVDPPSKTAFWKNRARFPLRSFGNTSYGDCTRAKQAIAAMRMERLETTQTATIDDQAVIDVYFAMTKRLYGGGDVGAFETDALDEWRRPDLTFRDTKGRPLTIDAYVAVNPGDLLAVRRAMFMAGAHGIAFCIGLPLAFQALNPPAVWDIPEGQQPIGIWLPWSWGGHSMWAFDYEARGVWVDSTWNQPSQLISWRAWATYVDEVHVVIDSIDAWRKRRPKLDTLLSAIRADVNSVSSQRLA